MLDVSLSLGISRPSLTFKQYVGSVVRVRRLLQLFRPLGLDAFGRFVQASFRPACVPKHQLHAFRSEDHKCQCHSDD